MHAMHTNTHTYTHTCQFIGSFETYQECSDACYAQRLGANKACAGFGRAGGALVDRVSGASCKLVCAYVMCVSMYGWERALVHSVEASCKLVCMCVCVYMYSIYIYIYIYMHEKIYALLGGS